MKKKHIVLILIMLLCISGCQSVFAAMASVIQNADQESTTDIPPEGLQIPTVCMSNINVFDITDNGYKVRVYIPNATDHMTVFLFIKDYTLPGDYVKFIGKRRNDNTWIIYVKLSENQNPYNFINYIVAEDNLNGWCATSYSSKFYTVYRKPAMPYVTAEPLVTVEPTKPLILPKPNDTPPPDSCKLHDGDANMDGQITAEDALLVLKHVVKIEQLSRTSFELCDINSDNMLTASDALEILKFFTKPHEAKERRKTG